MTVRQHGTSPRRAPAPAAAVAILLALTLLAFSPVLAAGFIRLDDYRHILENASLQRPSFSGLLRYWTQPYFGLFIPVTYSVWWATAAITQLFGPLQQSAWVFHALNLACHMVNAALVFLIVARLLRLAHADSTADSSEFQICAISLVAAALFAVHPAQVETVAWVAELKGLLSTMAGLLGIWSYYRFSRRGPTALLFIAAMLAKPSGIVFPGVLLLLNRVLLGKTAKESVTMPALLWVLSIPLVFMTKHLQPDLNMDFVPTAGQRLTVAADALAFYLGKLVFPFSLALDYGRSPRYVLGHVHGWKLAGELLLLAAGLTATVAALLRPRGRTGGRAWLSLVSCGCAVFLLSLGPVLGMVPFKFQDLSTVADHYMYVAILGASLAVAGLGLRLRGRRALLGIATAVLLVSSALALRQSTYWKSTETLFEHTLTVNQHSYLAQYSIGADLIDRGRLDEGIERCTKSLALNPSYLYAQVALGTAWIQKGQFQKAIDHYLSVLGENPSFVGKRAALVSSMHNNLGMALHQVGRHDEGTAHFRSAVEVDPKSANGHLNLAKAEFNARRYLDALAEYEKALALSPSDPAIERQVAVARRMAHKQLLDGSTGR